MTPEHPNATRYRRTADAFRARDYATLATLIADDVVWHVPARSRLAGDIVGRDALIAWLTRIAAGGFRVREHYVFGNDEHVCALSVMGVRRPGTDAETRVVSIFHYRDGRQAERWIYPEDAATWERILDALSDGEGERPEDQAAP